MSSIIFEAKTFVINRLTEWLDLFPGLRLCYYFEPCSDAHIVDIEPESFLHSNEQFIEAQLDLIHEVEYRFSEHGMIFLTHQESQYLLGKGTIEIQANHSTAYKL
jgi:hypothetical protein